MTTCAVGITEEHWAEWLHAISNMQAIRTVEFPASLLIDAAEAREMAARYGLEVTHARNLLPADITTYFAESPPSVREDLLRQLKTALVKCDAHGVRFVCVQLGLDRIGEQTIEHDLAARVKLLQGLMSAAEENSIQVCVQVRCPRSFPDSKEWEYAGNLVHEVMHPRCRLAVNVVPMELPPEFDIHNFVRTCYFKMKILRFFYNPGFGEALDSTSQAEWAETLQRYNFKGAVVFCPRAHQEDGILEACRRMDQWAELYGG